MNSKNGLDPEGGNEWREEAKHPPQPIAKAGIISAKTKKLVLLGAGGIALIGGVVGLSVGLTSRKKNLVPRMQINTSRLSYFDASVLNGYEACRDLEDDLMEAAEIIANITIENLAESYFRQEYNYNFLPRGGGFGQAGTTEAEGEVMFDVAADSPTAGGPESGSQKGGESSFDTNNQVAGVDEADLVKSDGSHVFAVYGGTVVVIDADETSTTKLLSRTEIPTEDDIGVMFCGDVENSDSDTNCYLDWSWNQNSRVTISSLLLHGDRLAVIATVSANLQQDNPILQNKRHTRVFVYDVSDIPTDGVSPLTLLARKDLQGSYKTARSIGQNAHVVTASWLDTYFHIGQHLSPWNEEYASYETDEARWKEAALEVARSKASEFATNLAAELIAVIGEGETDGQKCSHISKVAVMLKSLDGGTFPSFTTSSVLQTLTMVHSFDLQGLASDDNGILSEVSSSGVFFPTPSYSSNVMSSAEKLIVAGESYAEDERGEWNEQTVLLVYDLLNNTAIPRNVGQVPGSILNQFSMDHYYDSDGDEDYIRVATTTWGRWGIEGNVWKQLEVTENQVSVLKIPKSEVEAAAALELVGKAEGLGMDERIYAVRFMGEKAYVVTFRQTDPFYTLDMSDPNDPLVVGELKILGFSNYLHPINGDLILAIGQNATETGRANGLQISLFNVSDFSNPMRVKTYVEQGTWSSSEAQYDHRAFRYLPQTKLLILPLSVNSEQEKYFFNGFVVYDVDEAKENFSKKFDVSHVMKGVRFDPSRYYSWCSRATLPPRSLVFDGDMMTLKRHTVLWHNLETEEEGGYLNLNEDSDDPDEDCMIAF